MKFSDIQEQHIYNVGFGKVCPEGENRLRLCEFDGLHLALVIKKNEDRQTIIVAPLTSVDLGDGVHKYNLGKLYELPPDINTSDTFVVYDQIRTVNASRFSKLTGADGLKTQIKLNEQSYLKILSLCTDELIKFLDPTEKVKFYYDRFMNSKIFIVIKLATGILNLTVSSRKDKEFYITKYSTDIRKLIKPKENWEKYILDIDNKDKIIEIIYKCIQEDKIVKEDVDNVDAS